MKTAQATIKGLEIRRMLRRRHGILREPKVGGRDLFHQPALSDCCLSSDLQ
jgi:hypothetical protein